MDAPAPKTPHRGQRGIDLAWAALSGLIPALAAARASISATDLAYHLRVGESILTSRTLPSVDTFTFTFAGTPWLDQQWGAQVVLALGARIGSWPMLALGRTLLVGFTFFLVFLACRRSGATPRAASLLTLSGFFVAAPALSLRPQILVLPQFALTLWAVAGRHEHPGRTTLIPFCAILAANMHGSFALFVVLPALGWVEDLVTHQPTRRRMILVTTASAVATLATPFGPRVWTYAYDLATNPQVRDSITEWEPLSVANVFGWIAFASVFAVVGFVARRDGKVPWTALATLGIYLVLALSAQRAIVWWALVAPVVIAGLLPRRAIPQELDPGDDGQSRIPGFVVIGAMCVLILAIGPWWAGRVEMERNLRAAPEGLTAAVQRHVPAGSRLMVDQPWGSWFEYAVPDMPVFLDSRIEIIPPDVWEDYGEVAWAHANWKAVLDEWNVEAIVANKDRWDLIPLLREDENWRAAYEDSDGVLFIRE
jgi:hypothetical protein